MPHNLLHRLTINTSHPFDGSVATGNRYVLVVTDLFSKWTEAFPLQATDSETLAKVLTNEVNFRYGIPSSLHSDQGANLTLFCHSAKFWGLHRLELLLITPKGMHRLNDLTVH